jgi:cobalamin biosynthesis protein CobT
MGKCYSRNASLAKDDTTNDEEVKNNSAEATKDKNEQTANGQVENVDEANANETAGSKKESSLKDKKGKTNKESKTVRITETSTTEEKTETTVTEEKSEQKSDDLPKSTQVIKVFCRSCCPYCNILQRFLFFFLSYPVPVGPSTYPKFRYSFYTM